MKQPVAKLRLGIPRAPFYDRLDADTAAAMEAALAVLTKLTASVKDCHLPSTGGFSTISLNGETLAYHQELIKHDANAYSIAIRRGIEGGRKSLDDVSEEPCGDKVVDYIRANWELIRTRRAIDDAFTDFDLVVLPTMRLIAPTINESLSREEDPKPREPEVDSNCAAFDIWGIPAISIPCGFAKSGLPIGLMIAGPRFSEGRVLALAHAYEQATDWHLKKPTLTPDMVIPPVIRK